MILLEVKNNFADLFEAIQFKFGLKVSFYNIFYILPYWPWCKTLHIDFEDKEEEIRQKDQIFKSERPKTKILINSINGNGKLSYYSVILLDY